MIFEPIIHTQLDLEQTWCQLMQPLGFGSETLWLMFIQADGRPYPHLTEITDCDEPDALDQAPEFGAFVSHLMSSCDFSGARVAALRSRPGQARPTRRDRAWAEFVSAACRAVGLTCETMHVASDEDILPMPWDDLGVWATTAKAG